MHDGQVLGEDADDAHQAAQDQAEPGKQAARLELAPEQDPEEHEPDGEAQGGQEPDIDRQEPAQLADQEQVRGEADGRQQHEPDAAGAMLGDGRLIGRHRIRR